MTDDPTGRDMTTEAGEGQYLLVVSAICERHGEIEWPRGPFLMKMLADRERKHCGLRCARCSDEGFPVWHPVRIATEPVEGSHD